MDPRRRQVLLGIVVSFAIYAVLDAAIGGPLGSLAGRTGPEGWDAEGRGLGTSDEQLDLLTVGLFDEQVFALEVLGVLLTAALIGAMVIARPLTGPTNDERYGQVTDAQLREAQQVSDVATRMGGEP